MNRRQLIWALVLKEYRELAGRWTSFLFTATFIFFFVLQLTLIRRFFASRGELNGLRLLQQFSNSDYFIGIFLLAALPMQAGLFSKEKMTGTIEWLLASPLRPRVIWLGKAAFLFLWGFGFALIFLLTSTIAAYYQNQTLGLEIPILSRSYASLLLMALPCAAFSLLISAISLVSRPRLVAFFTSLVAMAFIGLSSAMARITGAFSARIASLAGMTIVSALLCAALIPMLTRERILLSGK
ncbi:MAG: ABC transporter permease [bacterium]